MEQRPLLQTSNLTVGYKPRSGKEKHIAGPIDSSMFAGELICLLGPNGAGKSTLLRTLSGLQKALTGSIHLDGENLARLSSADIARKISLVLTDSVKSANLDVYSLISLGRYPYSGWLGSLSTEDKKIIQWAIESTHVESLLKRKVSQLSDGECQKVMLARALAQDTPLIILDEPTAHLDLPSRIELMRLLHQLTKNTHKGILISTHELDLALQVADQIWLLKKDGHLEKGLPETLVLNGSFEAAFDKTGVLFDKTTGTFNIHENTGGLISVSGNGAVAFWTRRALLRNGFRVNDNSNSNYSVEISETQNGTVWIFKSGESQTMLNSLEELISLIK